MLRRANCETCGLDHQAVADKRARAICDGQGFTIKVEASWIRDFLNPTDPTAQIMLGMITGGLGETEKSVLEAGKRMSLRYQEFEVVMRPILSARDVRARPGTAK